MSSTPPLLAMMSTKAFGKIGLCPIRDFVHLDVVQFGILSNSGFCLFWILSNLGFCPIRDFVHSGFCSIRDFVQLGI